MAFYSVVIPVKDEAQSLKILYKELKSILSSLDRPYEIIFIDDGSIDKSVEAMTKLQNTDKQIKIIKLRGNFGKSAALSKGFEETKGKIIIMLDADLQDNPREIPKLLAKLDEGYDLISGWRRKRLDSPTKRISSYLFNRGTALISGVTLHDFNCGLKVLRSEVAKEVYLHGELHRFIPVLAAKKQFKVGEVKIAHRTRRFGESKYGKFGIGRGWKAAVDLLTSIFLSDYATKPAHFFGKIGLPLLLIGFILDLYVTYVKVTTGTTQGKIPLLLAGILLIIMGIQLLSTGLIAEMITHYFMRDKRFHQENT